MRFSILSALACVTTLVHAVPIAEPVDTGAELSAMVTEMFEERFFAEDIADFKGLFQKRDIHERDLELTAESLLLLFNSSGIIWDVLDQVAYSPSRISFLANKTASLLSNVDLSSLGAAALSLTVNYSAIYSSVESSGLVSNLLDGILLDEDYRPVLVKLVSRVLEGNKNLFLYLVQDVFKKSKREMEKRGLEKRSSTLETFVGNIVSAALGSSLVGGAANDIVVALNNTGVATYIVKELIANEGYQNMTAQLVLDVVRTGKLKASGISLNVTSIADKVLGKPTTIVALVTSLFSGKILISGLGKYATGVKAIVLDVQKKGVFKDLNQYVFSETHTVTTPLIATKNIVVAKTTATTTSKSKTTSKSTAKITEFSGSETSYDSSETGSLDSAEQVASILALLGVSTTVLTTKSKTKTKTSTSSTFDLAALLSAEASATDTAVASATDSGSDTTSSANLAAILALLGDLLATSANAKEVKEAVSTSASSSAAATSSKSGSNANRNVGKAFMYTQAVIVGGLLLL